jgi:diguanylate cyclase (GGDEF)-like protein
MKKKSRTGARGTKKTGKQTAARRKTVRRGVAPRPQGAVDDGKATIRLLRMELAEAMKRIEELQASAETDFLLGIPNRRGFERELNRVVGYINRYHASAALIVLDVDRLKPINDAFGHSAGDQVLKAITDLLTRQVRSSDVVGRLGGDEFALLLWNLTETDARAKAAHLEAAVDSLAFRFRGHDITAGASAGIAVLGPSADAGRALEEADRAMYVRKAQRRHETRNGANGSERA